MNDKMWKTSIDGPEAVNIVAAALVNLFPEDELFKLMQDPEFFGEDAASRIRTITVCDDGTAAIRVQNPHFTDS